MAEDKPEQSAAPRGGSVLGDLSSEDRMNLLRFVCAFAWADYEVSDAERRFVRRLIERAGLDENERGQVLTWLDVAPPPHDVVASQIPTEHAQIFIEAIRALIYADGRVDPEERERFDKLAAALRARG